MNNSRTTFRTAVSAGLVLTLTVCTTLICGTAGAQGEGRKPMKNKPREAKPGQATELSRQVAADAGSAEAPLLFCIGMHIEPFGATVSELAGGPGAKRDRSVGNAAKPGAERPERDYNDKSVFSMHAENIKAVAGIVEKHGGKLTIQSQTPFTRMLAENGDLLLTDLAARGHEIALHFHEQAHLGQRCDTLPVGTWSAVMAEEIGWIKKAAGKDLRIRYWSGGNNYPQVLQAAATAGLETMSDHKNPHRQETDAALLAINPWRPAGGPTEDDMSAFIRHDPAAKIVYLPDGIFASADFASRKQNGDAAYLDFLTDGLERSLRAARKDRVNVFHITMHPGELRGRPGDAFEILDRWLTKVVDPLVAAKKARWATFSEMGDAFRAWEKANPGVDPRAGDPAAAEAKASAAPGGMTNAAAPAAPKAYMTFAVNIHDWVHPAESADTIVRLVKIFQKYKVRGDFYFTAPVAEAYAQKRPDAIQALTAGGMTISYHLRPPHPAYTGFDQRLKTLDDQALAATLKDYETFRLDLATGDVQRDRPGGYAYVAKLFGKPPVTVSPQCGDRRIKSAIDAIFAEMGAKMVLAYHESGTKVDRPFEFLDGLLVRPSDFSITRWALAGEPGDSFWWNRMEGRLASPEFNPTQRLKKQLAEWKAPRPPFITSLIHENNYYQRGPESWKAYYLSNAKSHTPLSPPYNLDAPDQARPRSSGEQDKIWQAYEELVAYAAANLRVVTSEDIVKLAQDAPRAISTDAPTDKTTTELDEAE